jgi:prefoldin subunit 5
MSIDLGALVRALEQDPEQRAALRRAVFGDQPDLDSALASLTERMDALAHAQQRTEERLGELAQRMDALAQAQQRTEQRVEELAQAQQRTEARLDELTKDVRALAVAQRATEASLKSLVDVVTGMHDRMGKLDGDALERRYRERGPAYLSTIARRLRLLDHGTLSPLVDDAERAGKLTPAEATSIFLADAIFAGRRRSDDVALHLVVEASVTIGRHDVRRARERADLFARVVDTPVLAVIAGEFAPEPVAVAAQDADVWRVTNGRAVSPTDDLDADQS